MNNRNERDNNLFGKFAEMVWILHRYHQENHNQFEKRKNNYEKQIENRILAMLKLQEEIDKKELMFILDIPKYHFDKILGKMEKEENVSFTGENDVMTIKITEKGKSKEEKEEKTEFDSIFDCLTDEEKINFFQYVETIVTSIKPKLNNDDSKCFDIRPEMKMERCRSRHGSHGDFDRNEEFRRFHKNMEMESERFRDRQRSDRHLDFHKHIDFRNFREDRENDFRRFFETYHRRKDFLNRENDYEDWEKYRFFNHIER